MQKAEDLIKAVEKAKLNDKTLGVILDALYQLSIGIYREEETIKGYKRIYGVPPDRQAAQFLTDRILGKVPNQIQGAGKNGEILLNIVNYGEGDDIEEAIKK